MRQETAKLAVAGYEFDRVERGQGHPVLLVHGSISDHRTWQPQIEAFASSFRAIAYSRRYHWPNKPIANDANYAMAGHIDDLEAVIASLAIAPVHLVGHSYGAFLCLLLASRRPELVRSLVLVEPPVVTLLVSHPPKLIELLRLFATSPRTGAALLTFAARGLDPATAAFRSGELDKGLRIFGTAVLGSEAFQNLSNARLQQMRDNLISAEFLGSGLLPIDPGDVRKIETPTLLVTGAMSPAIFHRLTDRLEELLPRAQRVQIAKASHAVHEDNAPAFNSAVLSFLGCHST